MSHPRLRVSYLRGVDGQVTVFIYRGGLHVGTVEVNRFNCIEVFRGRENSAPVFVKYLPKEDPYAKREALPQES